MKKGFTLIEMLSVIIIISLLSFVVIPPIINQYASKKEDISEVTQKMIVDAAELYATETSLKDKTITLNDLVKDGKLEEPIKDYKTGKEIPLTKEISISSSGGACIVGIDNCSKITHKKFTNGEVVYFNPETGEKCDASSAISTPGTKKGCMKWYAFNDNETSNKVSLLLDHNTTIAIGKLTGYVNSWSSLDCGDSVIVNDVLIKDTATWKGVTNVKMINKVDLGQILNQDYESCSESSADYCFGDFGVDDDRTYDNYVVPCMNKNTTNCDLYKNSSGGWLRDNLNITSTTDSGRGYYSSDSYLATSSLGNKTLVRIDSESGYSSSYDQACDTGVRPVVIVEKYKLQ